MVKRENRAWNIDFSTHKSGFRMRTYPSCLSAVVKFCPVYCWYHAVGRWKLDVSRQCRLLSSLFLPLRRRFYLFQYFLDSVLQIISFRFGFCSLSFSFSYCWQGFLIFGDEYAFSSFFFETYSIYWTYYYYYYHICSSVSRIQFLASKGDIDLSLQYRKSAILPEVLVNSILLPNSFGQLHSLGQQFCTLEEESNLIEGCIQRTCLSSK